VLDGNQYFHAARADPHCRLGAGAAAADGWARALQ
jgi:hypothetical protein